MTAFLKWLRIAALLFFGVLFASHGPQALIIYMVLMGLAFGYPNQQLRLGMLGAAVTTTNPTDFADRSQVLFNKKILKALQYNLRLAPYGLSEGYSPVGTAAVRFFRPRKANISGINAANVTAFTLTIIPKNTPTTLTEGTKPTNLTEVAIGYVDIYLGQRATLATVTDITTALDLFNTVSVYTKTMGEDLALDYDSVCRNSLINGLYNSDSNFRDTTDGGIFERFSGVVPTGDSSNDWLTLSGQETVNSKLTRAQALNNLTQLRTSKVPTIGDRYVAVTMPAGLHDLRQDQPWLLTQQYQDKTGLYKYGQLELDGCVYVEQTNPWVEGALYGTEQADNVVAPVAGLIYTTIFLGAEAFGIPKLNDTRAGGGGASPRIMVLDKADKNDPLNQQTVIGAKSFFGAGPFICNSRTNEINERPHYTLFRHKSTFI